LCQHETSIVIEQKYKKPPPPRSHLGDESL